MKFTYGLWALLIVISLFTAGFFPTLIIGALAVASSISTGLHVQSTNSLGSSSRKSLY